MTSPEPWIEIDRKNDAREDIVQRVALDIDRVASSDFPDAGIEYGTRANLMIARAIADSLIDRYGSTDAAKVHIDYAVYHALRIIESDSTPWEYTEEYQDHLNEILKHT